MKDENYNYENVGKEPAIDLEVLNKILDKSLDKHKYLSLNDSIIVVRILNSDAISKVEHDNAMVKLCTLYRPIINSQINKQGIEDAGQRSSLFSLGALGVYDAVAAYDENRGYKLSTVINTHVKKKIKRDFQNTAKFIRTPVHVIEKEKRIYSSLLELKNIVGKQALKQMERDEILKFINDKEEYKQDVTIGQLNDFMDNNFNYTMLESTIAAKDNSSIPLSDRVGNGERTVEDKYEVNEGLKAVEKYLRTISPRDALVFVLFFGNFWKVVEDDIKDLEGMGFNIEYKNHNYEEISRLLDISSYKVKTICNKVTLNVRNNVKI